MYDPINNVQTVVLFTSPLSLLISNANKRAVKTYEVEVSVRKALLITLYAAQGGSRRIAVKSSPITGLDRPRGFQEVKVPRFRDNGTRWW